MPDAEFKELKSIKPKEKNGAKACRYWNSSIGCAAGDGCPFAHNLCYLCGKDHKWYDFHAGRNGSRQ